MEPLNNRFGGGAVESQISTQVAVLLLIAIVLILALPRTKTIVAFLIAYLLIPIGEVIVIGSLHFTVLRILILAGLVRVAFSKRLSGARFTGGFNPIDQAVALWAVSALVIYSLQWMEMQAFINRLGDLLDALGAYIVVRYFIPDGDTVRRAAKALAAMCLLNGAGMIIEQFFQINVFGLLGGVSPGIAMRDGHIRSSGVMGCLYAGAFAGALIPVFFWLWTSGKSRLFAAAGILGATAMVITSNSSTSYMALAGGLIGLGFWPLRKAMRFVRWGLVAMLVGAHLVMKAPVWALIARIDLTGSSSGNHRYELVDNCIRHFWDWWLLGSRHFNDWGWGMWDLANQFVLVAVTGGLLTLIFYILIFQRSFAAIGTTREQVDGDRSKEWAVWCFGAPLFASIVASFGINSVPQMLIGFFATLACISISTFEARQAFAQIVDAPARKRFVPNAVAIKPYLPMRGPGSS
jgi:hypothetical protein